MDCASPSVERSRPSTKRRPSIANILNRRRSSVELGQAADGRSPHGAYRDVFSAAPRHVNGAGGWLYRYQIELFLVKIGTLCSVSFAWMH
jgi:hypothetical protein